MEKYSFKGWVPTVTARLSFGAIGHTSHPTLCKCVNIADEFTRFVVLFQKRNTSDVIFPLKETVSPYIFKLDGRFMFVIVAKTDFVDKIPKEKLVGSIYIYKQDAEWVKNVHKELQNCQNSLYNTKKGLSKNLESSFLGQFSELNRILLEYSYFSSNFELKRNGECELLVLSKHFTERC